MALPLIDVSALLADEAYDSDRLAVGLEIDAACRDSGFFLVTGHGIEPQLRDDLERLAREFFALPEATKAAIAMHRGGVAWRGWFPVGDELTSGEPDRKEGIYFGAELAPTDPRVLARTPLHGPNLFPSTPARLGAVVLGWIDQVSALGQTLLQGVALGLGIAPDWFATHLTTDPTLLFRIFHYPPGDTDSWGVGEHTDYGLLTLLAQDRHGGLQVRTRGTWVDVPADPYVFVVNIGDMLEKMTGGLYRSNPHRVRNLSGRDRLSFPLFVDPSWDARVTPLPEAAFAGAVLTDAGKADKVDEADKVDKDYRWDGQSVHAWEGVYGDYLSAKVAKVFPQLAAALRG